MRFGPAFGRAALALALAHRGSHELGVGLGGEEAGRQGVDGDALGWRKVPIEAMPFKGTAAARSEVMIFNIAGYSHTLLNDFLVAGGSAEFRTPSQIASLGHKVV